MTEINGDTVLSDEKTDSGDLPKNYSLAKEFPESVFAQGPEKWLFAIIVGISAWLSTLSIPIYFPTLTLLAHDFHVSVAKINVTATVYSIFQGISPLLWGPLSDTWGRRPVYFCCASLYLAANISLACCHTYSQLLGLRILQAFGGASTVSLIGGVVGDFSTRKTRGSLMGTAIGMSIIAGCFGPLAGSGIQTQFNSWRAIFWALAILAGIVFGLVFFLLPETNRHLVGNGSRSSPASPKFFMSRSIYAALRRRFTGLPLARNDPLNDEQWKLPARKISWFRWAELFFQPRVLLTLFPTAVHYTTWYMVLTAQSTVLADTYHFTTKQIGYTYLSSGLGSLLTSILSGQLMQYSYRCEARYCPINIYKARFQYSFYASALLIASTLAFGWSLHFNVSFYVPVVMTFIVSGGATFFLSTTSAILVDLFPDDSAAGQSCNNLARCCMCAGGLAAIQSMMDNMTIGGTFSFMAGLCGVSSVCIWYLIFHYGPARSEQTPARILGSDSRK